MTSPSAAAVCYRRKPRATLEFLLVRTKAGRWTFPKGGVETGEATWQAAGREALEEAGVTGRIAQRPLGTFPDHKLNNDGTLSSIDGIAHLLEVDTEQPPSEAWRAPQWLGPDAARIKLAAGRRPLFAWPLSTLIELAVATLDGDEAPSP